MGTLDLLNAWFSKHGRWPQFVHLLGHNHLSSTMHFNSPDGFLGERILDLIERHGTDARVRVSPAHRG